MKLSKRGLDLIADFEGFRGKPYNDPARHATIGFGHLLHHGPVVAADVKRWKTITRKQGLALLRKDVARFEDCVNRAVKVKLAQPQFDALVSFAFNVGCGAFRSSTLLKLLNAGHRERAAKEFQRWNKAGGRVLAGLTRRRAAERKMFLVGPPKPKVRVPFAKGPSKNFSWLEVHKGRPGMTAASRARAIVHARKMERLRGAINGRRKKRGLKATGINVLSWFRSPSYNRLVGGASKSRHMKGDACDISIQEIRRLMPWKGGRAEFDLLCNIVFREDGFGQYPAGNRHVDSRGYRARWSSW